MATHTNQYNIPAPHRYTRRDLDSRLLETACLARGMSIERYSRNYFSAERDEIKLACHLSSCSALVPHSAMTLCNRKNWTRHAMATADVPVPKGEAFGLRTRLLNPVEVLRYASSLGYPLVVKPEEGTKGAGVTVGVSSAAELIRVMLGLWRERRVVIEEQCSGQDYRFLVLGGQVISVLSRQAAQVIGNGASSILALIEAENESRSQNPRLRNSKIVVDASLKGFVRKQYGCSLSHKPKPGEVIQLRSAANISQGGAAKDITDEVHASIKAVAVKACKAIPGLELAGVDMMIEDHHKPASSQSCHVIEVNYRPAIGSHEFVSYGKPVSVSDLIVGHALHKLGCSDTSASDQSRRATFKVAFTGSSNNAARHIQSILADCDLEFNPVARQSGNITFELTALPETLSTVSTLLFVGKASRDISHARVTVET